MKSILVQAIHHKTTDVQNHEYDVFIEVSGRVLNPTGRKKYRSNVFKAIDSCAFRIYVQFRSHHLSLDLAKCIHAAISRSTIPHIGFSTRFGLIYRGMPSKTHTIELAIPIGYIDSFRLSTFQEMYVACALCARLAAVALCCRQSRNEGQDDCAEADGTH